jgi:nucleotide-binding universal stress UspA family protein
MDPTPMKTVLSLIDFSDTSDPVLEAASELARAFHAKIVLAHVFKPAAVPNEYSPLVEDFGAADENRAREELLQMRRELEGDGLTAESILLYGPAAAAIRAEAERIAADFIVLGSHGHGALYDLFAGSTAADLLRLAPCPVLVVPVTGQVPSRTG